MRLFLILFVFSSTVSFGQWKSFYPEKENAKSKQFQNDKNEKKTLLYNNLFFNAIKQKSLENFDHAIKLFEKCIEEKPDFFEAYYQLSLINKKEENDSLLASPSHMSTYHGQTASKVD